MGWAAATVWWVVAGVMVAVELASGTFYLLMLALGAVAAALAAHAGLAFNAQLIAAAAVGGGAVAAWHVRRLRQPAAPPTAENRDINLDIGERVHVTAWDDEGAARVSYRGASWAVRYAGTDAPAPGVHVISAVQGSELMVKRLA